MTVDRIQRKVETAANMFLRKCKRLGNQIYWLNNCGDVGVKVWSLRNQFTKSLDLEFNPSIEYCDFYIPRQYNTSDMLIFPILAGSTQKLGIGSRIYEIANYGKLYTVINVEGDVQGIDKTAVFRCTAKHQLYNPFAGTWTPTSDNIVDGMPMFIWNNINSDTTAKIFNGYFIDASSNSVTLTLPSNPYRGHTVAVRVLDRTNSITIASFDLIEGDATLTIPVQVTNGSFWLTFDNPSSGGWHVVSELN